MSDSKAIFSDLSHAAKRSPGSVKPLAVFDLDSTLYNVSHRSQAILQEFVGEPEFKSDYPAELEALAKVKVDWRDWGLKQAIVRHELSPPSELTQKLKSYWTKHFFSSEFLVHDVPYEGAVDYVNDLLGAGVKVLYLTGRDMPNMKIGTGKSLKQWNFPSQELEENLYMKPAKGSENDEEFKANYIEKIIKKHLPTFDPSSNDIPLWFFENEPLIIESVRNRFPNIQCVWTDTTHSGRRNPPVDLPTIREGIWRR